MNDASPQGKVSHRDRPSSSWWGTSVLYLVGIASLHYTGMTDVAGWQEVGQLVLIPLILAGVALRGACPGHCRCWASRRSSPERSPSSWSAC